MGKWGKVWHLSSIHPWRCLLLGVLAFPDVLGDAAQEGPFMGERVITNPSTPACLSPPLSLYSVDIVALC